MPKKASDLVRFYQNQAGPTVSTVNRRILEEDGLTFKDIDGSGKISKVNDWRLPAKERAKAYVKILSIQEKIAQLFISDWRMGKYPLGDGQSVVLDESGTLDEGEFRGKPFLESSIFQELLL